MADRMLYYGEINIMACQWFTPLPERQRKHNQRHLNRVCCFLKTTPDPGCQEKPWVPIFNATFLKCYILKKCNIFMANKRPRKTSSFPIKLRQYWWIWWKWINGWTFLSALKFCQSAATFIFIFHWNIRKTLFFYTTAKWSHGSDQTDTNLCTSPRNQGPQCFGKVPFVTGGIPFAILTLSEGQS